jgi:7-cyano-7-deazaguanine synthase in queuosine biosynthesis
MKKIILQAISGGYDSTWLLIKNLKEGHELYPIYIHSSSVSKLKQVIEINSVKNLIQKLQLRFDNLNNLSEIEIKLDAARDVISMQPIFWMLGLFNDVKNMHHFIDYDEVHIGYVMCDSTVSYQHEILNFWKSLFSFSFPDYKVPKLIFPLKKYQKAAIINNLEDFDCEILADCWFCENPKIIKTKKMKNDNIEIYIESCGECNPCIRIKNIHYNFNGLKKHKAVINLNDFKNSINETMKTIVNDLNFQNIHYKFFTIEEID